MAFIQFDVDVMNMALRRIGAEPISLSEANNPVTKASKVVASFFESTVKEVLRIMPWNCAVKRFVMAAGVANTDTAYSTRYDLSALLPFNQWTALTPYNVGQLCLNNARVYLCTTAGTSAAATGPVGTVINTCVADGTVYWCYLGPSSGFTTDFIRTLYINGDPNIPYVIEGKYLYCNEPSVKLRYIARIPSTDPWDAVLTEAVVSRLASKICFVINGDAQLSQLLYQEFTLNVAIAKQISAVEDRGDIIDLFGLYQNAQLAVKSNMVQG